MQLIPDLFTLDLTHVIGEDNTEAGTIQANSVGFTATLTNGKPEECATFQNALKYIETGKAARPDKPQTQYQQFNLF